MGEQRNLTRELESDHGKLSEKAESLDKIASELDELSSTYQVAKLAEGAKPEPETLARLGASLATYRNGLAAHFAKEDVHLPKLAREQDAREFVQGLMMEHREVLNRLNELLSQIAAARDDKPEQRPGRFAAVAKELHSILAIISAHAEKEDEVLFILDHNA